VISAIRKPSALAKPDVAILFAPRFLVVEAGAAEVVVEEEFEQVILDGTVKLLESVRSAH
jgi:hypothetical protein